MKKLFRQVLDRSSGEEYNGNWYLEHGIPPKDFDREVNGYIVADEIITTIPCNSYFTIEWNDEDIEIYKNLDDYILEYKIPISSLASINIIDKQLHIMFFDSLSHSLQKMIIKAMPEMLTKFYNEFEKQLSLVI